MPFSNDLKYRRKRLNDSIWWTNKLGSKPRISRIIRNSSANTHALRWYNTAICFWHLQAFPGIKTNLCKPQSKRYSTEVYKIGER